MTTLKDTVRLPEGLFLLKVYKIDKNVYLYGKFHVSKNAI